MNRSDGDELDQAFDSSRQFRADTMTDLFDEAEQRIAERERERRVAVELAEHRKATKATQGADALDPLLSQLDEADRASSLFTQE